MANPASDYKARNYYQSEAVATEYDHERFTSWYGKVAHQTEAKALQKAIKAFCPPPGKVLDLPCGTARLFPVLLAHGLTVTGADISPEMLEQATRAFQGNSSVNFEKADAENLPFSDNQFEYLTSYRLMCHLPAAARKKVVTQMVRVTSKALVINYHFASNAPLALFNKLFRPVSYPTYPVTVKDIEADIAGLPVEIVSIEKLSWYERSSALVVLKKK
jgi:ubiquinone/menaquinone biosynthesis C-methylase UbiE